MWEIIRINRRDDHTRSNIGWFMYIYKQGHMEVMQHWGQDGTKT